jgi:hypothetical protein
MWPSTMRKWSTPNLSTLAHAETRPNVQHALFLVLQGANRIRAKRLTTFLLTLVEAVGCACDFCKKGKSGVASSKGYGKEQ